MRNGLSLAALLLIMGGVGAEEDVRLSETFAAGQTYHVRTTVELSGTLTPPAAKGKAAKQVKIQGTSDIEYDERVIAVDKGAVSKSLRVYKKLSFERTIAGQKQAQNLRANVRRLVILRKGHSEVPFSPDGPLMWGEIDAVRVDVFVPALAGLLPNKAAQVGDTWEASDDAVLEVTDLEKIEKGKLSCKFDKVVTLGKRRLAQVSFSGLVSGVGEDGPVQHKLSGVCRFDIAARTLTDLALTGTTLMVDADGKETGRIEGKFSLLREPGARTTKLTDEAIEGVKLEPDDENTQLLYDNKDLGVRFLHSRRWRIGRVTGTQVALDAGDGGGIVITLDPPSKTPAAKDFLAESRQFLEKQKAKVNKVYTPARLRKVPPLDGFALDLTMGEQKVWMDYYLTTQANGGATVAARLLPNELAAARKEVDRIARTVDITKKIVEKR